MSNGWLETVEKQGLDPSVRRGRGWGCDAHGNRPCTVVDDGGRRWSRRRRFSDAVSEPDAGRFASDELRWIA